MDNEAIKHVISERIEFVFKDAKTYIYARKEGVLEKEDLGGGNFANAYAFLALMNLLSKIHYYLHKPDKFTSSKDVTAANELRERLKKELSGKDKRILNSSFMVPRELQTNELNAFISFARELEAKGILLHEPHLDDQKDFSTIWNGFRNMLAHLATVQSGKGISAYSLEQHWPTGMLPATPLPVVMEKLKEEAPYFPPFHYDTDRSAWIFNVDTLIVLLEDIKAITLDCIDASSLTSVDRINIEKLLLPI